jgi:hypothetical protein
MIHGKTNGSGKTTMNDITEELDLVEAPKERIARAKDD